MTERTNPAIIIVSHDNAAFLVDEFGRYSRDYDIRPATSARIASDISTEIEATGGHVAMYVADSSLFPSDAPQDQANVLAWPRPLDVDAINAASSDLLGRHDFASFCKKREGATTIRTLLDLSWVRDENGLVTGTVRADAFCHHMVRSLVGCLVAVGEGQRPVGWAGDVLAATRRDSAVRVVAAHGLTLEEVAYPPDDELAGRAGAARRMRSLEDPA